ncbi:hypothetical protein ACIRSS_07815 [Amycolatopsis sp. NPDC101161]|uniref:hypothetical protein n=1 Tax=Amycolatopsis sp. NPDC101161 TaxID=3363940 RepID=UPI0038263195
MRSNSRAWPGRFHEVPWREITTRFDAMAADHAELRPLADIAGSVLACGGERQLAGLTSMHDLVVAARPLPEHPPVPVVVVRSRRPVTSAPAACSSSTGRSPATTTGSSGPAPRRCRCSGGS